MSSDDDAAAFEPSKLGTKQYWDEAYEKELENFENHRDEGEIWFGKQCEKRIIDWCSSNFDKDTTKVLDIGSGNGHLLLSLSKKGYKNLTGLDYSENAVKLGLALFEEHGAVARFASVDFLNLLSGQLEGSFDLILDKGTFDAISLTPSENKRSEARMERVQGLCEQFKCSLRKIWGPRESTRFIITSCNWTLPELTFLFAPEFTADHQIQHPSFSFGGASGQVVTTAVFRSSTF